MGPSDEIRVVFRAEALEMLREMVAEIDSLSQLAREDRREAMRAFMRHAHNLKGASSMVDREDIESLAHAIEGVMSPYAKDDALPPEEAQVAIEDALALMHRLVMGESSPEKLQELLWSLAAMTPEVARDSAATRGESEPRQPEAKVAGDKPQVKVVQGSIRVDTARLDRLMAHAGALLIAKSRQAVFSAELLRFKDLFGHAFRAGKLDRDPEWRSIAQAFDKLAQQDEAVRLDLFRLSDEINVAMKRLRMQPLRDLAPIWRRVVNETAVKLDKEVEISFDLGEIELDRYVLDGLRDPLMHFLRNAVDHGIEAAAEREALGKPRAGRLLIRSRTSGGMVSLEISDDGRGLRRELIGEAAVAKGLITVELFESMSDAEVSSLLFLPGFSTAKEVSRISGRGVGLDVVKQRIEELGGAVEIAREPTLGGSTFVLTLPVSLLSSQGLMVRCGDAIYVLPTDAIELLRRIDAGAVAYVGGKPVAEDSGEPLRLCWLRAFFGKGDEGAPKDKLVVVVVMRGEERLGLVVDEVLEEQELVTLRLPWNLRGASGINGAVVMADGSVAVAVDVGYLFDFGHHLMASDEVEASMASGDKKRIRVLVVEDSMTARLELVRILAGPEYQVVTAADGEEGFARLEEGGFDIVITDIQMPRLDGLALVRRLRGARAYKDLPVVLVTSLASPDDIAEGAAAGADEYLIKGRYSPADLLGAIARLV